MTDLAVIPHQLDPAGRTCRVVIETPGGRRAKYDYDRTEGTFMLAALLPEGMSFPLDFGFVPSTLGEDGDPLDVLVLFDEPCAVGAVVHVRLIGVIEAEQSEGERTVRNDRLLAVAAVSRLYAQVRTPDDLGQEYLENLNAFWRQYNLLKGKRFAVKAVRGADAAVAAIKAGGRP
ncbi:MAG: Inorganic pyrophosphatase [Rhodospirillales bacterium]|jgi:inorganic pyrophosphatase|nr:Inorganic pyrophosphatase [Rhodospirillales bacterium]